MKVARDQGMYERAGENAYLGNKSEYRERKIIALTAANSELQVKTIEEMDKV